MAREVIFAPEAQEDLLSLYDYIDEHSGPQRAHDYTERIVAYCLSFETFPDRGTRRDVDIGPGLTPHDVLDGAHGGDVTVESTEGEGSTFRLRVPLPSSKKLSEAS